MNERSTKNPDGNKPRPYEVGYGKPPMHTRFRKGVSGNPRGGSRTQRAARVSALALKEAYRMVTVREGDKVTSLPAIQAVMRSQVALAVKGSGPAQRAMIAAIHALEQELATEAAAQEKAAAALRPISNLEAARRIKSTDEARARYQQHLPRAGDRIQTCISAASGDCTIDI